MNDFRGDPLKKEEEEEEFFFLSKYIDKELSNSTNF
jgi:hypothetical protein